MERAREVVAVPALGDVDAAGAAADDDAEVGHRRVEAGVAQRLAGREHGDLRDLRVAARIGAAVRRVMPRRGRDRSASAARIASSGTDAITRHGRFDASNSAIARVPLTPRVT